MPTSLSNRLDVEPLSSALLIKALDGLSLRAVTTAQNIANAGAPGYRPLRVSFEQALATAARRGPTAVAAVEPQIEFEAGPTGLAAHRLDLEVATASSTALRYAALVEVLNRQLQLQNLAITGNG
jgi:flagellar basal-body rod protein FlgB